ncbi:acyltransferase [Deinococcus aquaticus]|uniref:acyltransferase n=1 Tax=Deinococcus aquaticus TaxID=328692 RepID=UPI003F48B081
MLDKWLNYLIIKRNRVSLGQKVQIRGRIFLNIKGDLSIGDDVIINSDILLNRIGGDGHTYITVRPNAKIIIGESTGISNSTLYAQTSIIIGKNVLIGGSCKIYDTDFHEIDYLKRVFRDGLDVAKSAQVTIEDFVFIGAHSIILKGSHIGRGSVIGAGSVVSGIVPPGEIWAGNPAKMIRRKTDD